VHTVSSYLQCRILIAQSSLRDLTELLSDANGSTAGFDVDWREGWMFRLALDGTRRRVCWLPHSRRFNGCLAFRGQKVVIGAMSGITTILDFSNV
jgi:hypothetical protein